MALLSRKVLIEKDPLTKSGREGWAYLESPVGSQPACLNLVVNCGLKEMTVRNLLYTQYFGAVKPYVAHTSYTLYQPSIPFP